MWLPTSLQRGIHFFGERTEVLAFDNFVLFDRVHLPIIGRRAGRGRGGLLSVRESVHEIADCPELCYTISGFNMPINPLESFLPISYALLAGRL